LLATSLSKGVADGIARTIKDAVWTSYKTGQHAISNAAAFTSTVERDAMA
jgi:hypothetical protein